GQSLLLCCVHAGAPGLQLAASRTLYRSREAKKEQGGGRANRRPRNGKGRCADFARADRTRGHCVKLEVRAAARERAMPTLQMSMTGKLDHTVARLLRRAPLGTVAASRPRVCVTSQSQTRASVVSMRFSAASPLRPENAGAKANPP